MRTLLFIVSGLVAGGLWVTVARTMGLRVATTLMVFAVAWVAVAGWNLWQGVSTAGYTVLEESPIFLVIAGVPLALLWYATRTLE